MEFEWGKAAQGNVERLRETSEFVDITPNLFCKMINASVWTSRNIEITHQGGY